jgi:hypothetical protein
MCGNQLEKKLAKQLLFVCLSELPSKQSRWERSQRPLPGKMRKAAERSNYVCSFGTAGLNANCERYRF